jgi:hypothetical protein
LTQRSISGPDSWWGDEQPLAGDRARFHAQVWSVVQRKTLDYIRRLFLERRHTPIEPRATTGAAEERLDAARFLEYLAILIEQLPEEDRELFGRSVDAGRAQTFDARERKRLQRLRGRLLLQLKDRFGGTIR